MRARDLVYLMSDALISPCGVYRYWLLRRWSYDEPRVMAVIGLNPSTADAHQDDPTIRRCVAFAKREGCGALTMLNLFALRATDPRVMMVHPDPVGHMNDAVIRDVTQCGNHIVVAAWGAHGSHRGRAAEVIPMIPDLMCLGLTKQGYPRHPLYVRADAPLVPLATPTSADTESGPAK